MKKTKGKRVLGVDKMQNEQYAKELASLIQYETISVHGEENAEKFTGFHQLLWKTFPLILTNCSLEQFGCSILLCWKGKSTQDPICLMSHHDVVEASGEWTYPPFSGAIADGKIWGRGTLDTKGNLWAILRAVHELMQEGFVPNHDVYIESACTEETDGSGADAITKELQRRGIRFSLVLDEGGMIMYDPLGGCDGDFAMLGIGEKAYADLRFVAKSAGGHASTPPKDTPLVRLGKFMAEADKAKCFDTALTPAVGEMFAAFAPYSKGILKYLFSKAYALRGIMSKVMSRASPVAAAMLRSTIAFTQAGGSDGTNVLPQEAYVVGNLRSSHHQGHENSMKAIAKVAEKYDIEMIPVEIGQTSKLTSTKTSGYQLVAQAVRTVFDSVVPVPYIMTGASDCRFFDRVSDCCIRFAPFKIDEKQMESIHGIDENLDISTLSSAVRFFKYIIQES